MAQPQSFVASIVKSELIGPEDIAITAVTPGKEANSLSLNITALLPRSAGLGWSLLDQIQVTIGPVEVAASTEPEPTPTASAQTPAPDVTGAATPMEPQA